MTAQPNVKAPHAIDVHVGRTIRLRRKLLGITQSTLADALGLTFQQVQKYERGVNRVSASVLWKIAGVLDCDIGAFFEGLPREGTAKAGDLDTPAADPHEAVSRFMGLDGGLDLARSYVAMLDAHRRAIVAAARTFARLSE